MRHLFLGAFLLATPVHASERCLMAEYRSPESIRAAMNPYLTCGLFARDGHFSTRVNGRSLSIGGHELQACTTVRQHAMRNAEAALTKTVRSESKRRAFVQSEFEKADQFLKRAAKSLDLGIDQESQAPKCRKPNAPNN